MIVLDGVSKSFDGNEAVSDLSISVNDGEVFGLVGQNGAGKTTTIKMIAGLLHPDRGSISVGGHDIVRDPMRAKSVLGYVPDRAFLYEKLSARELLVFISSLYGVGQAEAAERIDGLLDRFGIKDVEHELIEGFSQGMRQRLLFAAALVHEPHALLIDEPFMGLDPFGVRTLMAVITDLAARGVTVFLATHSLHLAEELCHRVGLIRKGSLIALRSREEVREADGGLEGLFLRIGRE
jgi:ABC-2 type transport system ATP-binding protein